MNGLRNTLALSRQMEDCLEDQAEQIMRLLGPSFTAEGGLRESPTSAGNEETGKAIGGCGCCRTGCIALMALLLLAPKVLAFPNQEDSARSQGTSAMLQTSWSQVS